MTNDPRKAIGIFDSGVGGLTVHRRVADLLLDESIVYLGDTARVPYGTRSAQTVLRYARACTNLLLERGIKLLVVACNTASAYALDALSKEVDIPVIGVIEPGARRAVELTRNGRIGVIGTPATIASGQYQEKIQRYSPEARVFCQACPLFVPLAEEGWTDGPVPGQVAERYLSVLVDQGIDTLILGCTHYPLLKGVIAQAVGDRVTLVDSAEATSAEVARALQQLQLRRPPDGPPPFRQFIVTDAPAGFARVGRRFLGSEISEVEWVEL